METNLNKDSQLPQEYKTLKSKEPKADFPVVLNMSNSATLYLCNDGGLHKKGLVYLS